MKRERVEGENGDRKEGRRRGERLGRRINFSDENFTFYTIQCTYLPLSCACFFSSVPGLVTPSFASFPPLSVEGDLDHASRPGGGKGGREGGRQGGREREGREDRKGWEGGRMGGRKGGRGEGRRKKGRKGGYA